MRRGARRRRVHWVDTHNDIAPFYMSQYAIGEASFPTTNPLTARKIIFKRQPLAVQDISSVLEGKDEGFRLRRIVGQLRIQTGEVQDNESFDSYMLQVHVGIAVLKMREDGTPMVSDGTEIIMAPWAIGDNSESWLFRRVYSWRLSTWSTLQGIGIRDNTTLVPFGDFVDVTVNRRVANDEDLILLMGYSADFELAGTTRTFPSYCMNLRMLISR